MFRMVINEKTNDFSWWIKDNDLKGSVLEKSEK